MHFWNHSFSKNSVMAGICLCVSLVCSPLLASAHGHNQLAALALPGGVEIQSADLHEKVTALRDDVLRVQLWRGNQAPEDASWAVLPASRKSTLAVTRDATGDTYRFHTSLLQVEVDCKSLKLTIRDLQGNILQQDARPVRFDGSAFRLYKSMPADEHYFGLGDKPGPIDRRGQAFALWNTDAYRFQESTDPIYKSIPYFISYRAGRAMGLLLDNTWRSSFDFGKEDDNLYSFGAADGPINYYLFYGPTARQVAQTYAWLTGTPPLPPLWAFGYQQSRYGYLTQERVLEVAHRLRTDRIPSDAIYLDIDFQQKNRPFTTDQKAFPDLDALVADLKKNHFHVVAITDLHIPNLPDANYAPYDSGIAGDHFVKNADGKNYTGTVWPGPSVFPDFLRQSTRDWWGSLYTSLRKTGVDGFWNDMNEPSVFDSPTHTMPLNAVHRIDDSEFQKRSTTHAEVHNVYGMLNSRATFEGLQKLDPQSRPFVLTRASYAGGQRYAVTWTGDNSATWNHLRMTTPMLENLGLSGFAFSGADVGGYAGSPTPELLTRWMQLAAFQPIDRDHSEKGTADQEPWVGGAEHESIRRRYIETRYALMPYLYTVAEEASRIGLPLLRPLFMEFPDASADRHPIDIDAGASSEFMLGPNLLVAPAPYPESPDAYSVLFPSANWYDFWTGAHLAGNTVHKNVVDEAASSIADQAPTQISPKLDELPVFVRGGAILPLAPVMQSTSDTPQGPLTLRIYNGSGCAGELYQDDGTSLAYQRGVFLRVNFSFQQTADGMHIKISPHNGTFAPWWKEIHAEIFGWKPALGVIELNHKATSLSLHQNEFSTAFNFPDDGLGVELIVK